ncbi:hypothetical protein EG350_06315 [Chryseobacterium shandongense]|nr:hypothetical protein EG350_06315 [Chryseobacterium shandongense]
MDIVKFKFIFEPVEFFQELYPALRTRYFFGFGGRGEAAPPETKKMSSNKASIRAKLQPIV